MEEHMQIWMVTVGTGDPKLERRVISAARRAYMGTKGSVALWKRTKGKKFIFTTRTPTRGVIMVKARKVKVTRAQTKTVIEKGGEFVSAPAVRYTFISSTEAEGQKALAHFLSKIKGHEKLDVIGFSHATNF